MNLKEKMHALMDEHVKVVSQAENIHEEEVLLEWIIAIKEATKEVRRHGNEAE